MDIQHAMICKKGGFIQTRYNDLRDLPANLLTKVCKDANIELLPVAGETFNNQTANTSNKAKVDIKPIEFWVRGQQLFLDARIFDPNANRYLNKALFQCYIQNEKETKQKYSERVLEIDHEIYLTCILNLWGYGKRL